MLIETPIIRRYLYYYCIILGSFFSLSILVNILTYIEKNPDFDLNLSLYLGSAFIISIVCVPIFILFMWGIMRKYNKGESILSRGLFTRQNFLINTLTLIILIIIVNSIYDLYIYNYYWNILYNVFLIHLVLLVRAGSLEKDV